MVEFSSQGPIALKYSLEGNHWCVENMCSKEEVKLTAAANPIRGAFLFFFIGGLRVRAPNRWPPHLDQCVQQTRLFLCIAR